MSALTGQGLIQYRQAGPVSRSTARTPVLSRRTPSARLRLQVPAWKRSWRTAFVSAWVVVALVAGIAVLRPWRQLRVNALAGQVHSTESPKTVIVTHPTPATTASVVLPATVRPWQTTTLHARVSGYLTAWHRELGSVVQAGEVLAEIETPELDQQVAEGEALASEAAAAAIQAQAERTESEAELKVAEAQLVRVRAEYDLAQSQAVRREKLVQTQAISQDEYEVFQRQFEARAADVAAAQSDVARRRTNLDTRAAIISARQATAKSRQANADRLKELQAFKRIIAPFDGLITSRLAEVGMLVTAGQESLFVIDDLSRVRVQINVPQTYAMRTTPGVAATISLPESNLPPVRGEITRIASSVDAASRTMLAEIELDNATTRFQPGSYAQVTLDSPQNNSAWTIPTNTISMRADGPHVVLVDGNNQIEIKRVALGRDLGNRVIVADGIRGGERLVVNPSDDLVGGLQVAIKPPSENTPKLAQR